MAAWGNNYVTDGNIAWRSSKCRNRHFLEIPRKELPRFAGRKT